MIDRTAWPALPPQEWAPTRRTLHQCAQMLGKLKLALRAPLPEWLHASLLLTPQGWTTGAMPSAGRTVQGDLDVVAGEMRLATSGGRAIAIRLSDGRTVADIWTDFRMALDELGVDAIIWDKPQELTDPTPFAANTDDRTLDLEHARRFHAVLALIGGVYEEFRSPFFGRTAVPFWWGGFDYAVLLFSGRHSEPPGDSGYILRHDLDAEHLNAGFWPGSDTDPPNFYAYLHPRPDGCEVAPVAPDIAGWTETMGEWVLPYDELRTLEEPERALLAFLTSVYDIAVTLGGWDEAAQHYERPPRPGRR